MAKYAIWDKTSDIYTLAPDRDTGRARWGAQEYIDRFAPWAAHPNAVVIVGGGLINGTMFQEFESAKEFYVSAGMEISEGATPEEVVALMEKFDSRVIETPPTPDERIATALEFQNIMTY